MRPRAGFGEDLIGLKLLNRAVVMVVGQNAGKQVDDRGVALMTVQADVPTRGDEGAAEAQFAISNAVDFFGEIDAGKDIFAD